MGGSIGGATIGGGALGAAIGSGLQFTGFSSLGIGAPIGLGPFGLLVGAGLGAYIDSRTGSSRNRQKPKPSLERYGLQLASAGDPIASIWGGAARVSGSVIWATQPVPERISSRGKSGEPTQYKYLQTFAVLYCANETVGGALRLWADGKKLYQPGASNPVVTFDTNATGIFDFTTEEQRGPNENARAILSITQESGTGKAVLSLAAGNTANAGNKLRFRISGVGDPQIPDGDYNGTYAGNGNSATLELVIGGPITPGGGALSQGLGQRSEWNAVFENRQDGNGLPVPGSPDFLVFDIGFPLDVLYTPFGTPEIYNVPHPILSKRDLGNGNSQLRVNLLQSSDSNQAAENVAGWLPLALEFTAPGSIMRLEQTLPVWRIPVVPLTGQVFNVRRGTPAQTASPIMETIIGAESTHGYRGKSYFVFDTFDSQQFSQKIPNFDAYTESVNTTLEDQFAAIADAAGVDVARYDFSALASRPSRGQATYGLVQAQEVMQDLAIVEDLVSQDRNGVLHMFPREDSQEIRVDPDELVTRNYVDPTVEEFAVRTTPPTSVFGSVALLYGNKLDDLKTAVVRRIINRAGDTQSYDFSDIEMLPVEAEKLVDRLIRDQTTRIEEVELRLPPRFQGLRENDVLLVGTEAEPYRERAWRLRVEQSNPRRDETVDVRTRVEFDQTTEVAIP